MAERADIPDAVKTLTGARERDDTSSDREGSGLPERRRRRRGGSRPDAGKPALTAGIGTAIRARVARLRRLPGAWTPRFLSSWGPSPTYRVLFFLGAIAIVMAFLVYGEYVISELKEQERDNAELYAHLHSAATSTSSVLPEWLDQVVVKRVVINQKMTYPIVITDHQGNIGDWRGPGLPDPDDRSAAALQSVRQVIERMDAERQPILIFDREQAQGQVFLDGRNMAIASKEGAVVTWDGPSLPDSDDTSAAARGRVRQWLSTAGSSHEIEVSATDSSYLYWEGFDFVVADKDGRPMVWGGPAMSAEADSPQATRALAAQVKQRIAAESQPRYFRIPTEKVFHYGDSDLITSIEFAPFITLGVLFLFSLVGYVGFRNIRRSEQRSIWVGMAKETAHQLGTPLSSLSGWLELMATTQGEGAAAQAETASIAREMQRDLGRLNQIASRFSQIGSVPELQSADIRALLGETITYFKNRGPQFGKHRIEFHDTEVPDIPLNVELMGWAFENLFKNAIDAIGRQEGLIAVELSTLEADESIKIRITDNGRGIPPEHQARVFEPGFSTKKRGWGLGLAFVKRIVEDYHGGRIQVADSTENGTSFDIILPTINSDSAG